MLKDDLISVDYSYATSVAELFFSKVKRGDINPERISTTKTKMVNTVRLVYTRILEIRRETIILFWHHIILHLFGYLVFKPL